MKLWPLILLALGAAACGEEAKVRTATKAGTWYTADPKQLRSDIEGYFAKAPKVELGGPPIAIVAPHAGYRYSGPCAGAAYALLRDRGIRRVIVLAPSHRVAFHGAVIAAANAYETPLGKVPVDRTVCDAILKSTLVKSVPAAEEDEHSLELQLPMLQVALKEFQVVPIVVGQLGEPDYARLAAILRDHIDAHTLIVASSDFTHYGRDFDYTPFEKDVRANIEKLDKGAVDLILALDSSGFRKYVTKTGATICGRNPIAVLLEMLTPDCRGKLVDYYCSGDENKDYSHSVSYAAVAFAIGPGEVSPAGRKELLDVARKTLQALVNNKELPKFDVKGEELQAKRGVFVTYKNRGRLRGCIGRFQSDEPLWKTVHQVAVLSARYDSRFADNPITAKEEPEIDIDISILSPMTRIKDPLNFIVGVHGLYIKQGQTAGTYLPQVATEQNWDKKTFITHLCEHKIGIAADAWKENTTEVYIYSAQVFADK